MAVLLDSWFVLRTQAPVVLIVLAFILWGFVIVARGLRPLLPADSGRFLVFPLAMAGWSLPVLLLALLLFAAALLLHVDPGLPMMAAWLALIVGWGVWALSGWRRPLPRLALAAGPLVGLFVVFLILRLAFIARTPLPLYFDSAEHYRIIRQLLDDYLRAPPLASIDFPVQNYYHVGYHLMVALMAAVSRLNLSQLMQVSGVVVLAALPFPLYVIPFQETGSRLAGLFAVLVGAIGWYVPAYVLNWGKYPALFGFALVLFTLDVAYLARVALEGGHARLALGVWALIAAGVAVVVHTRAAILIAIGLASWWLSGRAAVRPPIQRALLIALSLALLSGVLVLLTQTGLLAIVLDPYLYGGLGASCLVALLSLAAFWGFPRIAITAVLTILFMCLGLLIRVPGFAATPLLDRPLVEMVLFAPLSILGGVGFAAVMRLLRSAHPSLRAGLILACLAVIFQSAIGYRYAPSSCCNFVTSDDVAALSWIQNHLGATDRVLTAMAPARDAPPPYPPLAASSDAGVWILPLTGRKTASLPYWTDFAAPATRSTLCDLGVGYVYVGGARQSFNAASLEQRPEWYQLQLALPASRIYAISACSP